MTEPNCTDPSYYKPTLTNNLPYAMEAVERWFEEIDPIISADRLQFISDELPDFGNIDEVRSITQLREYFMCRMDKYKEFLLNANTRASSFTAGLLERLCIADFDHQKVQELEKSLKEVKDYNMALTLKQANMQNELDSIKLRLKRYELEEQEKKKKVVNKIPQTAQYDQQRKALKQVAEIFKSPVPMSNVATLCKQFSENENRFVANRPPKFSVMKDQKVNFRLPATHDNKEAPSVTNRNSSQISGSPTSDDSGSPVRGLIDSMSTQRFQRRSKSIGAFYQQSPYRTSSVFYKVAEHN